MKQRILLSLVVALLCVQPVLAKEKAKAKEEANQPAQALTPVDIARQEKEALITNINSMRNQEIRAAVLQQLLNEEIAKLRNIQAVFCDQYKLDVDKFRKGLYRYDEKQGKFVEIKPGQ